MYKLLRSIHLFLGLFLCLFVVTYGMSSIPVAHPGWFPSTPTIVEQNVAIGPGVADSPRALARELMDHHGLRGAMGDVHKTDDGFRFGVYRTGTYA